MHAQVVAGCAAQLVRPARVSAASVGCSGRGGEVAGGRVAGGSPESVLAAAAAGPAELVKGALGWERRLRRAVEDEPPSWTPARCSCGDRNLRWDARVGYFVCGACGKHVGEVEERGLVADEAGT
ncbi:hypothetical protein [Nonomuraea wenchangensis]|uniref:hypothetical protein n=1 Tax=Nonomuraea wenchangensis TaxID=568860 RepID=UPI0033F34D51